CRTRASSMRRTSSRSSIPPSRTGSRDTSTTSVRNIPPSSYPPRLRAVLSFARRRYLLSLLALAGLLATWAAMLAFDWSGKLGTIALAPWVALLGFDIGIVGGIAAAVLAVAGWMF